MVIFLINNNTLVVCWVNDMKNQAGKFILRQKGTIASLEDDNANVDH